jgi:multidrug resistance efflux pump
MDLLLILTYTAICTVVFKVFKIPLNKWTVPTAALGGVVLILGLIFLMNYNHPYSEMAREYFISTPIVPTVSGQVIEVPVVPNQPLKKGDLLFRIDPVPFENRVRSLQARLVQMEDDLVRAKTLFQKGSGPARNVDLAQAQVDDIKAQLANAEYELQSTEVRALSDGYVTQVAVRPGAMAVSLPLRPVMVFINSGLETTCVGWFRQNYMLRLKAGYEAEVVFDAVPGEVFSGEVMMVFPAMAEGQIQPTGDLISPRSAPLPGRVPVLIKITDPRFEAYVNTIPGGAFGQAAVYSDHMHHVAIMRKILLRMSAWLNYIFPFH